LVASLRRRRHARWGAENVVVAAISRPPLQKAPCSTYPQLPCLNRLTLVVARHRRRLRHEFEGRVAAGLVDDDADLALLLVPLQGKDEVGVAECRSPQAAGPLVEGTARQSEADDKVEALARRRRHLDGAGEEAEVHLRRRR
jgi:hypothetical protein